MLSNALMRKGTIGKDGDLEDSTDDCRYSAIYGTYRAGVVKSAGL